MSSNKKSKIEDIKNQIKNINREIARRNIIAKTLGEENQTYKRLMSEITELNGVKTQKKAELSSLETSVISESLMTKISDKENLDLSAKLEQLQPEQAQREEIDSEAMLAQAQTQAKAKQDAEVDSHEIAPSQIKTKRPRHPVKWLDKENPERYQEEQYCAPALQDPRDNSDTALEILGIRDPNFIQNPNAFNILQNAYDFKIKKCVTDKSIHNKYNYKTNIDKAYHFLDNFLKKKEESELLQKAAQAQAQAQAQAKQDAEAQEKTRQDALAAQKAAQDEESRDASMQQKIREEEESIHAANTLITKRKEAEKKRLDEKKAAEKIRLDEKKAAEKKRLDEINVEINKADKNVERIKKEEASKTLRMQEAAKDITNQINNLDFSQESLKKQQLLRYLRQIRAQQPIQYATPCENEPSSRVGIDSNNFNNCYLNALFQMLFHMCYFRRTIIDNRQPNFSPAIDELADILYRYQQLYIKKRYEILFLSNNDYYFIKREAGLQPNSDTQEDPMEILTTNDFFAGTHGIANQFIYNNPQSEFGSKYVYQLIYGDNAAINLQYLIFIQEPTFFNGVQPNTEQKYIILNYPRFDDSGFGATKKQNSVEANPIIFINEIKFVLKGIIVHLGENTGSGHYIYVTFTNDGQHIDKIYDNSLVTNFSSKQRESPNDEQLHQILQERVTQFNELMNEYIKTFDSDPNKQRRLIEMQKGVIENDYLLGHSKNTLNNDFKLLFETLDNEPSAEFFKNASNTIDLNEFEQTVRKNGTIFLYENISSRVGGLQPHITHAEKQQLQKATIAAMSLFKIPYNKTFFQIITKKELTNKRDSLLEEIENNVTDSPDELEQIVVFAYNYLIKILDKIGNKIIGRALNRLPLEKLNTFYESLKQDPKDYLLAISSKFLEPYKRLNYKKSMIIQTPKLNVTRKATQGTICNELGQLNPLFNSQKGIPSILRKLTRKITREEIYKPIKARIAIKEADTKKAAEKKSKQTIEQIDAAEKDLKEIKTQKIVERIGALSQEINVLRENPVITPKAINKKLGELRELKKLLESEEQQPPKKETKGGTNKIIRITKQHKKTRKLN